MRKIYFIFTFALLCFNACTQFGIGDTDALADTEWQLVFIRKTTPIKGTTINISFENDEIRGTSGCNTYFGSYEIEGEKIKFNEIAMTEMACLDPEGVMQQEQDYLSFLSEVVLFSIEGNQLILRKAEQGQLTFEKTT